MNKLLKKLLKINKPENNNSCNIKSETIFNCHQEYEFSHLSDNCINLFTYKIDDRRGLWINALVLNKEVALIQIQAGREGDDKVMTFVTNEKLMIELLGNRITNDYKLNDYDDYEFIKKDLNDIDFNFFFYYDDMTLEKLIESYKNKHI